jgi:hypothetical protein
MFGRGRPLLVAVITDARSRERSFTRSNISINTTLPICQFGSGLPFTQPPPLGRPVDPVRTRTAPHRALPLLQPCSRSSHFFPFIHSFIFPVLHSFFAHFAPQRAADIRSVRFLLHEQEPQEPTDPISSLLRWPPPRTCSDLAACIRPHNFQTPIPLIIGPVPVPIS